MDNIFTNGGMVGGLFSSFTFNFNKLANFLRLKQIDHFFKRFNHFFHFLFSYSSNRLIL